MEKDLDEAKKILENRILEKKKQLEKLVLAQKNVEIDIGKLEERIDSLKS